MRVNKVRIARGNMTETVAIATAPYADANPVAKARLAGLAYLTIILAAPFSEMFVRSGAIVRGDAAATAANVLAREQLWRWAGAAEFLTAAGDVFVAILLYEVLKPSGKTMSLLAAVFQLILVALSAVKILFHMAPLSLLKAGATFLTHFSAAQLQDLSYLSLRLHGQAYDVSLVFFGVHCIFVGWLIARATYFPRVIGWMMLVAGACYIANTIARFVAPQIAPLLYPWLFLPGFVGETALMLCLLIGGVNAEKWRAQAAAQQTHG